MKILVKKTVPIKMTLDEMNRGALVGLARCMDNFRLGISMNRGYQHDRLGFRDPLGFLVSIQGTCAELAFGIAAGVVDQFPAKPMEPDFWLNDSQGKPQAVDVKHSYRLSGNLLIGLNAKPGWFYALMLGTPPRFQFAGMISDAWARECGEVREFRTGGKAILVDQKHLAIPEIFQKGAGCEYPK